MREGVEAREARLAWMFILPAVGTILLIAVFPLGWSMWESLHLHDLRMPWRGQPFIGLANYREALATPRFWEALQHTLLFTVISVTLELALGLVLALVLHHASRVRGVVRTAALVSWAMPTAVAALVWRFLFESRTGIVNAIVMKVGTTDAPFVWFIDPVLAWVPIIVADVWKTTPFVALLLLASLQNIDPSLYEAARVDGASRRQQFLHITFPLLQSAFLVALIFRTLDAFRVFDLIYVMTSGGPGTATEPLALYTFGALFNNLRFGYGAALAVGIFVVTGALALLYLRILGREVIGSSS
jgi:multiple sugar transport system permease protein